MERILPEGYTFIYDEETGEGYVWTIKYNRCLTNESIKGYLRVTCGTGNKFLIHRLIAQHFIPNPDKLPQVDHLDGNKQNNKLNNLRWVSISQNLRNKPWKGYTFDKRKNKFKSSIMRNGKQEFLGYFDTEEEARQSYLNSCEEYFPNIKQR